MPKETLLKTIRPKSIQDIQEAVKKGSTFLAMGSRTSTVIAFEIIDQLSKQLECDLLDLSQMPQKMEINSRGNLLIEGAVSWKDARAFCWERGYEVMTSPTEELALVLSGVATSCTGERCFGLGTLREQVVSLKFVNFKGEIVELSSNKSLMESDLFVENMELLNSYQNDFNKYSNYKNAPFPRLKNECDLMIGFEGQLGIIVEAELKIRKNKELTYIFIELPKWEVDDRPHLELYSKVQNFRDKIISCELIDENSWKYLPEDERPVVGKDTIFLEVESEHFENVYEDLLGQLELISQEQMFEMNATKCREFRVKVPRAIFEVNSRMGVTKKGTDAQVDSNHFKKLLILYRDWAKRGVAYNLFGHFGDAHLHFNFMPTKEQESQTNEWLNELYENIFHWKGSPFAEHGIGLIKQKFISRYYDNHQKEMFQFLKDKLDPKRQFFPSGFMKVIH